MTRKKATVLTVFGATIAIFGMVSAATHGGWVSSLDIFIGGVLMGWCTRAMPTTKNPTAR